MVILSSAPSSTSTALAEAREQLRADLQTCRQATLALVADLTPTEYAQQAHPDFSPVGWHLGHIAFTESLWILEKLQGNACPHPHYRQLFAADGLPKAERQNLPDWPTIQAFLAEIRDRTLTYLDTAPLQDQLRLWRWLLQHECQHAETMALVLAQHRWPQEQSVMPAWPQPAVMQGKVEAVLIPAGTVTLGSEAIDALDNERPSHQVHLGAYGLDRTPVTVGAYRQFITAGGYQKSNYWTAQGWDWVQSQKITQPLYWRESLAWDAHPVCGVSWYEADAYARFVGKRLPTEAEWEKAAHFSSNGAVALAAGNYSNPSGHTTPVGSYGGDRTQGCDDLFGNVWEWTDSWFAGYDGFEAYPYRGYSQIYFDGAHRVLRGGSWATQGLALRSSFRNWYHPQVRQMFAGFRCAQSV
ncbi:MAG: SUMF1/EgtB/PvdO family nonheme iron enzyme [Cyanobacteria bacterium]|nr:SUMF1/EgtB/PvdO family nonheme iron enzyme [Cyanobacteriota bacterium]